MWQLQYEHQPSMICGAPDTLLGWGDEAWEDLLGVACFPAPPACWLTWETLMGSENKPPELSPDTAADLNFFGGFPPDIKPLEDFKGFAASSPSIWRNDDLELEGLEPRAIKSPACGTERKKIVQYWDISPIRSQINWKVATSTGEGRGNKWLQVDWD